MQKTKLGISVGLMGAAIYFMSLYGGFLITGLLVGYVLLFEENLWLKKNAVKAFVISVLFSVLYSVLHLIPNAVDCIHSIVYIFDGKFTINLISKIVSALSNILNLAETVLVLCLGLMALSQGSISVPVVDKLIDKYMG